MRIFVYEFVTGGGFLTTPDEPIPHSLLAEGHAMLAALATDFAALPEVEVTTLVDHRLAALPWPSVTQHIVDSAESDWLWFAHLAARADWTVVIAPEFARHLERRAAVVEGCGGKLLGPSAELIALCADKTALLAYLADAGVRVAQGRLWTGGEPWPHGLAYPVVLKPNDGAGSLGVQIFAESPVDEEPSRGRTHQGSGLVELPTTRSLASSATNHSLPAVGNWRIETLHPGQAASVALLTGPGVSQPLRPCEQRLSADGRLAYLGGRCPLGVALEVRALRIAEQVAAALPSPCGYLGIDLLLGHDPTGSDDRVVEVNPRLTTSYIGLRAASRDSLAAAMLAAALGRRNTLSWRDDLIEFDASGELRLVQRDRA